MAPEVGICSITGLCRDDLGKGGTAADRVSAFGTLVQQLQAQHDSEVAALLEQISVLRAACADYEAAEAGDGVDAAGLSSPPPPPLAIAIPALAPAAGNDRGAVAGSVASPRGDQDPLPAQSDAAPAPAPVPVSFMEQDSAMQVAVSRNSARKSTATMSSKPSDRLAAAYGQRRANTAVLAGEARWRELGKRFLLGPGEAFVFSCIFVNIALSFVSLEIQGRQSGALIGLASTPDSGVSLTALATASYVFTTIFAIELTAKLVCFGRELFVVDGRCLWFNIFDAAIVMVSIGDAITFSALEERGERGSIMPVLRGLRLVRVLRLLHIARTFRLFSNLRVLVGAVFASFFALFWAMVLLSVVMLMAALFMSQAVNAVVEGVEYDDDIREFAYLYYGTPSRACWSVFELTFSGGWPNYVRPLVEKVGWVYAVFFALYISAVTFGMFRIITALFLKDTLRVAALDIENVIDEKLAEKKLYAAKLADFFVAADSSGDGFLTIDEFDDVLGDERVKAYLASLELDPQKTRDLFNDAGDQKRQISIEDFVKHAIMLKGTARSQDVFTLMKECEAINGKLDRLGAAVGVVHRDISSRSDPAQPQAYSRGVESGLFV